MFIILYPLGLIGELIDIYYTAKYVNGKNVWGHILPSWLDFGVAYFHIIIALTSVLVPRKYENLMRIIRILTFALNFISYSIFIPSHADAEEKSVGWTKANEN